MKEVELTFNCAFSTCSKIIRVVIFIASTLLFVGLIKTVIDLIQSYDLYNYVFQGHLKEIIIIQLFIILLLGITGCYAAWTGRRPLMRKFQALLIISIVIQIILTVHENENLGVRQNIYAMRERMHKYNWMEWYASDSSTKAWDVLQNLRCCGIYQRDDWDKVRPYNVSSKLFPGSCCPTESHKTLEGLCDIKHTISDGCSIVLRRIEPVLILQIIYCPNLIFILILTIITCSCCTLKSEETIRSEEAREYKYDQELDILSV